MDTEDAQSEYELLRNELSSYSVELAEKPHCVLLTKTDLLPADAPLPTLNAPDAWGVFAVSAVTRRGLQELLEALWSRVRRSIAEERGTDEEAFAP
jgi:GTP-binding protein